MNILYTIPSLEIGGAEIFLARLSNQLIGEGNHKVFILDFEKEKRDENVVNLFSKNILVLNNPISSVFLNRAFEKIELVFNRRRGSISNSIYATYLSRIIKKYKIDVVHSHLYRSDRIIANSKLNVYRVTTLHGCYNAFKGERLLEMTKVLSSFDKIVYISERNLEPFEEVSEKINLLSKTTKIYNGVDIEGVFSDYEYTPFKNNKIHVVIVSRCIKEKGWETVIFAVKKLNEQGIKCELQLVGDGDYLPHLKKLYDHLNYIQFIGKSMEIDQYIAMADICCFPSVYKNESFPNTILEYMIHGKAIVSNDIGEVRSMLESVSGEFAGILGPINTKEDENVEFYYNTIKYFHEHPQVVMGLGKLVKETSAKYGIKLSVNSYLKLYNNFKEK